MDKVFHLYIISKGVLQSMSTVYSFSFLLWFKRFFNNRALLGSEYSGGYCLRCWEGPLQETEFQVLLK